LPRIGGGNVSFPGFTERRICQQNVDENQKTLQPRTPLPRPPDGSMQLGAIKELLPSYGKWHGG